MGNTNLDLKPCYPKEMDMRPKQVRLRNITNCSSDLPCGRVPCSTCGTALQFWFIKQCSHHFGDLQNLDMVSIVHPSLSHKFEAIHEINFKRSARFFRELITSADVESRQWLGGVDLSLNIDTTSDRPRLWCDHAMMITPSLSDVEIRNLRKRLPKGSDVLRPLKVTRVYDLIGAANYTFKGSFSKRELYETSEGLRQTRKHALNGIAETMLINEHLDSLHQHRLITIGLRRNGSSLVKV